MKKQFMILTIIVILFSSSVSAGFWELITGRTVGNETNATSPITFYVDVSDAFEIRIGDTAIYRAPNGAKRKVTLNNIEKDLAFATHTTVEGYKDQFIVGFDETFLLDANFNLKVMAKISDNSIMMAFEQIPKMDLPSLGPECNIVNRGPLWDRYWENLGLDEDAHPALKYYRIRWFSGGWSGWYTARVGDLDWKRNFGGEKRRVWSYFRDHTHEFVNCPVVDVPTPEPEPINETPINITPEPEPEPINETPINITPEPINETPINITPEPINQSNVTTQAVLPVTEPVPTQETTETIEEVSPIAKEEIICRDGCLNENTFCVPVGIRLNNQYCDISKEFREQKIEADFCNNNFECSTNLCIDSACVSSSAWKRFITFFARFFS